MAKEARRYEALAAYAAANGYVRLKRDAVQGWTRLGLIPKARVDHVGYQIRATSEPVYTGRLLLRACHYRYDWRIRDIAQIGVLVWMDGYPVADSLIRAGLVRVAEAPIRLLRITSRRPRLTPDVVTEEEVDAAAVAAVYYKGFGERLSGAKGRARKAELTDGLANLVSLLLLTETKPSEHLGEIGKLLGLGGLEFARGFPPIAGRLRPDVLATRIADCLPAELDEARDRALSQLAELTEPAPPAVRIITVLAFLAIGDLAHSG